MAQRMKLRVIVDGDDFRRLELLSGIPESIAELHLIIRQTFGVEKDLRIQYMDFDFNNEFMNLSSVEHIQDRSTIKLVYLLNDSVIQNPTSATPNSTQSTSDADSVSSGDSNDTVILPQSESTLRMRPWPKEFPIPRFAYDVELQVQRGNETFKETGIHLSVSLGLKSDILEKMAQDIFQYTAYPQNYQLDHVAEALINKFPCLRESGSACGYYGWKISLKYKMANYRTKMRNIGCPEVTVNALKNKPSDECLPAKNVKKPKKAEVNYCPAHPTGETDESLEKVRIELLSHIKRRNNAKVVSEKMSKTFSYRRKEVVHEKPMIRDFRTRWPALFHVDEMNTEFQRITTVPLETTLMARLDDHLPQLISVFQKKGGVSGKEIAKVLKTLQETGDVNLKRESIIKALCLYFGEDDGCLIKEYMDIQGDDILRDLQKTVMGIYVIKKEGGAVREVEDIGIVLEGVIVLDNLRSVARACAMLLGLIYALNLVYPKELRYSFEFIQKVLMQLDGERLSPRVLGLKNKISGSEQDI